jgi:REP element-mobilizing transposase RayT
MDRYWLITSTCYGTWLPGDERGFVGNVRDPDGAQIVHNIPGTPYDADMRRLKDWVRQHMTGSPVTLERPEAEALIAQYQETTRIRHWSLEAASVMYNHTHIVVGVRDDPDPQSILETLKSWATRALKKLRPQPPNGAFWTAKGSKRKLPDEAAVRAAVTYVVKKQPNPLAVIYAPHWQSALEAYQLGEREEQQEPGPGRGSVGPREPCRVSDRVLSSKQKTPPAWLDRRGLSLFR